MGGVLGLGSIVPGLSAYKGHTVALDVQCSLGYSAPLNPAKFETNWGGGGGGKPAMDSASSSYGIINTPNWKPSGFTSKTTLARLLS